jgi:hypothetical protein
MFENGGDKEHRPWMFDAPGSTLIVDTYRAFVDMHYEIGAYLLHTGSVAYESGNSSILPSEPRPKHLDPLEFYNISDYSYKLGDAFFISPIMDNTSVVSATFPEPGATWFDWFNHSATFPGGSSGTWTYPLTAFPVWGKCGTIIPLNVSTSVRHHNFGDVEAEAVVVQSSRAVHTTASAHVPTPLTDAYAQGEAVLSLLVHTPSASASMGMRQWKAPGVEASYRVTPAGITFTLSATNRAVTWRLRGVRVSDAAAARVRGIGGVEEEVALPRVDASSHGWEMVGPLAQLGTAASWGVHASQHHPDGTAEVVLRLGRAVAGMHVELDGVLPAI